MQLPEKKGLVSGPEIVSRTAVKLNLTRRPVILKIDATNAEQSPTRT
jgi:hypothetical protein